jgi:threonine synthase
VLVSKAAEIGVRRLVADSSGNAGVSIAAYAARAGIEAEVFLPAGTSESKVAQLRRFGAAVRRVEGSRAAAAAAAVDRVESSGSFYASHVFNPLFHHGTKTFAFELWEQLGGRLPQTVVLPAGNGTLLIGASLGFEELVAAGAAERVPRLIAVQAERCAPLAAPRQPCGRSAEGSAEGGGDGTATPGPPHGPTVAEGIAIAEPPRLEQMREVVEASGGEVRTVSEEAIATARDELARLGIDVEPTAAVAYAARHDSSDPAGSTVVALTGAGLKSPGSPRS